MINARSYTKLSNHECIEADYGDRVSSFQSASTYFSSGLERERERKDKSFKPVWRQKGTDEYFSTQVIRFCLFFGLFISLI